MNKNPLVDYKVSLRNLEKAIDLRIVYSCPESDVNRGVSIRVSLISAFWTLKDCMVSYSFRTS
ncbi:MAG: hypothetical protein QMD14_05290, partial [Candidatus Aenigmarchaeota archaeon]|nr:hypothetical protein [Candidatus Aenigmarchaeota archaeon]